MWPIRLATMTWYKICETQSFAQQISQGFEFTLNQQNYHLFIIKQNQQYYAYQNQCPHTQAPLNWQPNVFLDSNEQYIQCSLHGALFMIETGQCVHGPCLDQFLTHLATKIQDNWIWIAL